MTGESGIPRDALSPPHQLRYKETMSSQTPDSAPRPVVLCILDGWAMNPRSVDNAVAQARTPTMDRLWRTQPHAQLITHGTDVGLPEGQMGNSEVGHMNLGAGRVVMQELPRIDKAVAEGGLGEARALVEFIARMKKSGGTAHLMGLLSPGGVHAHQRHIAALANTLIAAGVPVAVHAFTDGRDTPPMAGEDALRQFRADAPEARIATVIGRYFAMDRDKRWDRVRAAYDAMVEARGEATSEDAVDAVAAAHAAGTGDEFVPPTVIGDYAGMADGDGILMANFRADRAREILHALVDPAFDGFERARRVDFAATAGMVAYSDDLAPLVPAIFPPQQPEDVMGEVVARAGLRQLRIAETEKYPHVTFFFNGGRETVFEGEERILIPSPKVATYDQQPEMSAPAVTDKLVTAIEGGGLDFIVVNYANGDMVGHTGDIKAAIQAVETVDTCLARVCDAVTAAGGAMIVTADHGNADMMRDPDTGQPHTAHTTFPVPIVVLGAPSRQVLQDGRLADVAPTLLSLMRLPQPEAMTGHALLTAETAHEEAPESRVSA
jgi:2,3-bisphosphoglycerate-independent phosphoglycerate mutase